MEASKLARAARFGIPVVETKVAEQAKAARKGGGMSDADAAAAAKRAERFGITPKPQGAAPGGKKGGKAPMSAEDQEKINKRKERFGDVGGGGGTPIVKEVDPEEEERRKKRAARFGLPA